MKIAIGADHAGFEVKEQLKNYLKDKGHQVADFGTYSNGSCDYPDYAHPMAEALENGEFPRAVGICGSGEGMAITLNKHAKVRASLVWLPEIAKLTRQHNDSNVLVLPARFISNEEAVAILEEWLTTEFEGGRHANRVAKITCGK